MSQATTVIRQMTNTTKHHFCILWWCFFISVNLSPFLAIAIDVITSTRPLRNGQTLVSPGELFELGFFNPGNSSTWYVGIWYKQLAERTVVWVANRDTPLTTPSGVLKIGENGSNLVLVDDAGRVLWSSNQSRSVNAVARLLDSGNFVLHQETNDDGPGNYLWQSFDYPTDTLLPGMKLGWDRKTGLNRYLTSWKKADEPSSGDYTFKLDINGYPEALLRNKQVIIYRSGPWNGVRYSGVPEMKPTAIITFSFEANEDEVYYTFELHNKSLYSRLLVNHSGALQRYMWIPTSQLWNLFWYARKDQCDNYRECGVYGICDSNNSPVCRCMKGFEPKNPQAWFLRDGSEGCVRENQLDCEDDGFVTLSNMKLPDSSTAFVDPSINLRECGEMCKRKCSCRAYANSNISGGGSGCVIWTSDLLDMRQYAATEGGQDLYVRVSASDLEQAELGSGNQSEKTKHITILAGIIAGLSIVLCGVGACILWQRRKLPSPLGINREHRGPLERSRDLLLNAVIPSKRDYANETMTEEFELPLFDFSTVAIATDNFSEANKLGQGGFGSVYKGVLAEGQEIAVKRLAKNSGQGVEEFKNEVKLIARLQHRNLVRLLGCCIDMEEKMLVYEYMKHKSLDSILFSKEKSSLLDWQKRFNIICGIARGLVYLHQDSRFRIIHRDLKAGNILLDRDMDPKISDFGMARIFGGDQTEANTKRVVGTYGYMSPEYAMDGLFSIKSDVFSFGVLVLEIISGKKNRGFYKTNNQLNLLAHAWKLWREGRGLELLDPAAGDSYSPVEALRCIHVGLLCVQEQAEDRPNMGTVALMLSSESISLTHPKNPGFCLGKRPLDSDSSSSKIDESCTVNQVTVTMLHGR